MFLPWQGAKTILIRSTYLQGLLEVNSCCRYSVVFRNSSKRKDSSKWEFGAFSLKWPRAKLNFRLLNSRTSWKMYDQKNSTKQSAMYDLQFRFVHVLRPRTAWLIKCNHLIGSSSHFSPCGIFKFHLTTKEYAWNFFSGTRVKSLPAIVFR